MKLQKQSWNKFQIVKQILSHATEWNMLPCLHYTMKVSVPFSHYRSECHSTPKLSCHPYHTYLSWQMIHEIYVTASVLSWDDLLALSVQFDSMRIPKLNQPTCMRILMHVCCMIYKFSHKVACLMQNCYGTVWKLLNMISFPLVHDRWQKWCALSYVLGCMNLNILKTV